MYVVQTWVCCRDLGGSIEPLKPPQVRACTAIQMNLKDQVVDIQH